MRMKRRTALILSIAAFLGVTACGVQSQNIIYQGKEQEARLVSEQLEDLVEKENPGLDIDIVMTVNQDQDE